MVNIELGWKRKDSDTEPNPSKTMKCLVLDLVFDVCES